MNVIERYIKKDIWTFVSDINISKRSSVLYTVDGYKYYVCLTFSDDIDDDIINKRLNFKQDIVNIQTEFYDNLLKTTLIGPTLVQYRLGINKELIADLLVRLVDVTHLGGINDERNNKISQ
jgi:hypothetical protein